MYFEGNETLQRLSSPPATLSPSGLSPYSSSSLSSLVFVSENKIGGRAECAGDASFHTSLGSLTGSECTRQEPYDYMRGPAMTKNK